MRPRLAFGLIFCGVRVEAGARSMTPSDPHGVVDPSLGFICGFSSSPPQAGGARVVAIDRQFRTACTFITKIVFLGIVAFELEAHGGGMALLPFDCDIETESRVQA